MLLNLKVTYDLNELGKLNPITVSVLGTQTLPQTLIVESHQISDCVFMMSCDMRGERTCMRYMAS
jgi:hypothetical protein